MAAKIGHLLSQSSKTFHQFQVAWKKIQDIRVPTTAYAIGSTQQMEKLIQKGTSTYMTHFHRIERQYSEQDDLKEK